MVSTRDCNTHRNVPKSVTDTLNVLCNTLMGCYVSYSLKLFHTQPSHLKNDGYCISLKTEVFM